MNHTGQNATASSRSTAGPAVHALAAIGLLALSGVVFIGELFSDPRPSSAALVVDAAVPLIVCLALPWLWSRLVPAVVALVVVSAAVPTAGPLAATGVLWLARRRPLHVAVIAAVAGVAAQVARGMLRPVSGVALGWWTVVVVAAYAAVVGWGAWMQAHRALIESLEERARRAEAEQATRMEQARQGERTRIAREMHDALAHRLSVLATMAGALEYNPNAPPVELARAADAIRSTAHLALVDMRDVLGVLRADPTTERSSEPGLERPQPTLHDLPELVGEWRRIGMVVDVEDELERRDHDRIAAGLGRTVYRIVQEALTNAHKHAPGETVLITLGGRPGGALTVTVLNRMPEDGPESTVPGSGAGLVGMAERVDVANGSFEAGPTSDGEHRVHASLPWRG